MPDYKKYIYLPAPPEEVYLALTKETSIQLWTGAPVDFKDEVGYEFSLWDGDILGKNIDFEYGKQLSQHWYFGEDSAPSIVQIKLHPDKKGTSLEFKQSNIPQEDFEEFTQGIEEFYLGGLEDFFEEVED